jgi:hypothetical protein
MQVNTSMFKIIIVRQNLHCSFLLYHLSDKPSKKAVKQTTNSVMDMVVGGRVNVGTEMQYSAI